MRPTPSELAHHWTLDPEVTYLNHGAFGACPREVLAVQAELRTRLERNAMNDFLRELEPLLDEARAKLGAFLHADPEELAFVDNATVGLNTVLRSLRFEPGDELLTTSHAYNAALTAMQAVAGRSGAAGGGGRRPLPHPGAGAGHRGGAGRGDPPDPAGGARPRHQPDRSHLPGGDAGAPSSSAGHRRAGRRGARAGDAPPGPPGAASRRTTPGTATSGSARRRVRPSFRSATTARRSSAR